MKPQLKNSKEWPGIFSCKFIEPGIVSYEDSDAGIALIKKETIDRMLQSFIGRPVCIDHQNITPDNYERLREKGLIVGNVIRAWFCPDDGWFHADFIIDREEGKQCIDEKGYSVSCAYSVLKTQEGGLWHDIKFDGEITDGSFTHLALVDQPRYEDSQITKQFPSMLVNGKAAHIAEHTNEEESMDLFKLFKKRENSKEDVTEMDVEIDGVIVPLKEVLNSVAKTLKEKKNEKEQKYMAQDNDVVDINGHTYTIAELKNAYVKNKKNDKEETEEEKKAREAKEMEAKNAKEAEEKDKEKKAAEEVEKENSKKLAEAEKLNAKKEGQKFYMELENAGRHVEEEGMQSGLPLTREERATRWASKHKK